MISSEASLQLFDYVLLGLAALGTSVISGFMGMAGGILLLVIMAEFFVPHLLIPLHGVVQLGSNASRVALLFRQVNHQVMVQFVLGALIGVLLGSQLVVAIPEDQFRLLLGGFILVLTWMPKTNAIPRFRLKFFFLGGFATFASLFIGATGPLLAPFFIRENF